MSETSAAVCRHAIRWWYDVARMGYWIEHDHDPNPEHRLFVPDSESALSTPIGGWTIVKEWTDRLHRYEELMGDE
ncbi:MAG: hypothetical protein AB7U76_26330 [Pirellulales bacterium]